MAKTWNRLKSYEGADDPEIEGFIDKASRGSVGQEAELTVQLEALEAELSDVRRRLDERDEISEAFEDVARHLADVDIDEIWQEATEKDRRRCFLLSRGYVFAPSRNQVGMSPLPLTSISPRGSRM